MKPKDIVDAWAHIRKIDQTIPDDVLDFMKDAALAAIKTPPRDPQPLVKIMKEALTYCESKIARAESGFSDNRFIEIMGEKFAAVLNQWEEGK